jgi:hypothetical protein
MEYLPEDISPETVQIVNFEDLEKGDYVMYYTRAFTYDKVDKKVEESFRRGGVVAAIIDEDGKKFVMLLNQYNKRVFSVQDKNVMYWYKSLIVKKGGKRRKKEENKEIISQEEYMGKKAEKKVEVLPQVEIKIEKEIKVQPQIEVAVEKKRGRPKKLLVEPQQEVKKRGRPKKTTVAVQ